MLVYGKIDKVLLFHRIFYPSTFRAQKYTLILLVYRGSFIQLSHVLCFFSFLANQFFLQIRRFQGSFNYFVPSWEVKKLPLSLWL